MMPFDADMTLPLPVRILP